MAEPNKESPPPTEEVKPYCGYLAYRARTLSDRLLPPPPSRVTAAEAFMEQRMDGELFYDDVDSEDEDWVDVGEVSHQMPQENDQEVVRLAKEGGPLQQTAWKLQEKAIEAAFEAAGVTGQQLVACMKGVAEDSGWLSNCNAVDDMVKGLREKYPVLKGAGSVLKELKVAFHQGRVLAEKERPKLHIEPRPVEQPVKASKIRREEFAGFEEVPLDETDLDCEGEVLER